MANSHNSKNEGIRTGTTLEVIAKGYTYQKNDGEFPGTNLYIADNPFIQEVRDAKFILDVGCGVGRNLPWIYENTNAVYVGLDPNEVMHEAFWKICDPKYKDRVILVKNLDELPKDLTFDVVLITFVYQHLGYRAPEGGMNITDITSEIKKYSKKNTIWFLYEHDWEEDWMNRWFVENDINPDVYIREYAGLVDLIDRGAHHLIIWKETRE